MKKITPPIKNDDPSLNFIGRECQNFEGMGEKYRDIVGKMSFFLKHLCFSKGQTIIFLIGRGGGVSFFKGLDTIFLMLA